MDATHPGGPVLLLAGPTATGKSAVALDLAERLGGEIVSVDSMQVYRGLDIGTAKPSAGELARVQHHLIDVADPRDTFSAARFLELARPAVREIHARGRIAILCGGTGLYFKAWLQGLGDGPPPDPTLRAELEGSPLEELLLELGQRDPTLAAAIDRQNRRRVMRAVEVIRLTGRPASAQRADWAKPGQEGPGFLICLDRSPADLQGRVGARTEAMFAKGLVEETRRLLELGLSPQGAALQAIGYRQVAEHLRGERSLEATVELVKQRTRQFIKRQRTWFRHQGETVWVIVAPGERVEETGRRVEAAWRFAKRSG